MKFYFFENVETLEDLRSQYKKLVFKHHPDRGGRTEDMQQINAEYEELLKTVGSTRRNKDGNTYQKTDFNAESDRFREIINKIINYNITVEICGTWIWCTNAYQYKTQLKEIGFFWCSSKKAWAWAENPETNGFRVSLDRIREMYGSEIIKTSHNNRLQIAAN